MRAAITSSIEGISPDEKSHHGDVFRCIDAGAEILAIDRQVFLERLRPQEPAERLIAGADPYRIGFEIGVAYCKTPSLSKRVLQDGDKIVDAIKALETNTAQYAQIHEVEIQGANDTVDPNGTRVCSWTITVIYDRRDPA